LQTWHGMVHVWQAFGRTLPESGEAFERMAAFIDGVRQDNRQQRPV